MLRLGDFPPILVRGSLCSVVILGVLLFPFVSPSSHGDNNVSSVYMQRATPLPTVGQGGLPAPIVLSFEGLVTDSEAVGPIDFPDGIYSVRGTLSGSGMAFLQTISGNCRTPMEEGLLFAGIEGYLAPWDQIFISEGCRAMLLVGNTSAYSSYWSITFENLSSSTDSSRFCDAWQWLSDVMVYLSPIQDSIQLLSSNPSASELRSVIADTERRAGLIEGLDYPTCMTVVRQLMLGLTNDVTSIAQVILDGGEDLNLSLFLIPVFEIRLEAIEYELERQGIALDG